jgi:hypothetical protein
MNAQISLTNFVYVIRSLKRLWVKETLALDTSAIEQAAEQLRDSLRQDVLWGLNGRFERGVTLASQGAVSPYFDAVNPDKHRLFQVKSANQYRPPYQYLVDLDAGTCECPDGHFCKHRIASHIIELVNYNRQVTATSKTYTSKDNQAQAAYQAQAASSAPVTETALSSPEPLVETNVPVQKDNVVIWGAIKHNGQWLGVEILALDDDKATIRALPKIVSDGRKLQPQFPFEGKRCTTTIPKKDIFHVKIFQ